MIEDTNTIEPPPAGRRVEPLVGPDCVHGGLALLIAVPETERADASHDIADAYAIEVGYDIPGGCIIWGRYHGKWVVLYFYPKDQTPGCTREAHNFQQDQPKYEKLNATVLGVSLDSVDSHKEFCAKEGLNFKLLSDGDHKVAGSYGSLNNLGVVKFAKRHTFLIDPEGKVRKVYTDVNPAKHSEEVLAALTQLQSK